MVDENDDGAEGVGEAVGQRRRVDRVEEGGGTDESERGRKG